MYRIDIDKDNKDEILILSEKVVSLIWISPVIKLEAIKYKVDDLDI